MWSGENFHETSQQVKGSNAANEINISCNTCNNTAVCLHVLGFFVRLDNFSLMVTSPLPVKGCKI